MGLLVDGVWQEDGSRTKDGHFIRPTTCFRNWVTPDGSPGPSGEGGFAAEPGRYHLYVALSCPWAHRTVIFRKLKGLENVISMSTVSPDMLQDGWTFDKATGSSGDAVNGKSKLSEIYLLADPRYSGRVSVPVLWDKKRKTIANNELSEIIRMLNSAFDAFTNVHTDYYPEALRAEIDRINDVVYSNVNNGVYRAGFATAQDAYELAFRGVFDTLDEMEQRLSQHRYWPERRHRGRLALFLHVDPFRRGLLLALQVQLAPHLRISQPVELSARPLSTAGRGRDGQPGADQAALLRQPAKSEPDRDRAGRTATRLRRAA